MYKIYLASHFFNRGGYLETEYLAKSIEKEFGDRVELYVPHRNDSINDKKGNDENITDILVYEGDMKEVLESDMLIANLDGVEIDSGVSGEIMALAMYNELRSDKKRVIGYTTDMRRNLTKDDFLDSLEELSKEDRSIAIERHKENFFYRNIMITGAVRKWGKLIYGYAKTDDYILAILDEIRKEIK